MKCIPAMCAIAFALTAAPALAQIKEAEVTPDLKNRQPVRRVARGFAVIPSMLAIAGLYSLAS